MWPPVVFLQEKTPSINLFNRIFAIYKYFNMAINKKSDFSAVDQSLAAFAKALSHPARIAILKVLAERNECICGQIVDVLPLAQSTVSQHLKELKSAGLISGTIDGPRSCYCINREAMETIRQEFSLLFVKLDSDRQVSCC